MAMKMADPRFEPTRRSIITTAGVAAVAGAGLAAGAEIAAAPGAAAEGKRPAGTGPAGSTVVEFRGRIAQTGSTGADFTSYGFLIKVTGLSTEQLFRGSQTLDSALFTAYATGVLTARVLDQSVHSLDIEGTLNVYQRAEPGASFADPDSFRVGRPVADYRLSLQDVLAVFAPQQGIPTLTGDMLQTDAHLITGTDRAFGRRGQRLRMFATGLGHLVDPVTLNAQLEIAGNWSAE
jgi:hypothetical protein